MINLVYFGTGNFSAEILEEIINQSSYKILAVITQPDKQFGRDRKIIKSPVKQIAEKYNLTIYQPEALKNYKIKELENSDIAVVAEYGLIIPDFLIKLPKKGTINIHTSLLPFYRGASPIQSAIISGETITGVSLMLIDKKMDHGPILAQEKITIGSNDLSPDLFKKLTKLSKDLFLKIIPLYLTGKITPIEQEHEKATYCKILNRDDGKINFNENSIKIYNLWRGLYPWPGIWANLNEKRLKLTKILLADIKHPVLPGEIYVEKNRLFIGCGDNSIIEVLELQLESKKNLIAKDFINGIKNINGIILK